MTVLGMVLYMVKKMKFSDQIRRAINDSGLSRYEICKRMDFSESVMSKFMGGKSGLAIETLDRLADEIGMSIATESPRVVRKRSPKKKVR